MKVVGVVARKGGVGKTTLAIHLAQMAAMQGETVVLVDMDLQASASAWRLKRKARGLDGVPVVKGEAVGLKLLLGECKRRGATLVVIDTRPDIGDVAEAVCREADHVLIPTGATVLDIEAIKDTALMAEKAGTPWSIVFNRVRKTAVSLRQARVLLGKLTPRVAPGAMVLRDVYADSVGTGQVAWEGVLDAHADAKREVGVVWQWCMTQQGMAS